MKAVWSGYGIVSINTWLWSTAFHARDNDLTEALDYLCAFSVVCYSLFAFFARLFETKSKALSIGLGLGVSAVFVSHVKYMMTVKFDYGYNMTMNLAVGGLNSVCWLAWAFWHRQALPHVKSAVSAVLLLNASILLEVLDFAPVLWTFDSHSLWHLSTAPVHFLWYDFVFKDLEYRSELELRQEEKKDA